MNGRQVRWRWVGLALLGALACVFAAGPRVRPWVGDVVLPDVPRDPAALDAWIAAGERRAGALRPDTEARIVWADPAHPARTACTMVYLHGFTASQGEGFPVHRDLARLFGCNLYLSRLPGHGLRAPDAMRGLSAARLMQGAATALAVGRAIGDRVIVIGTSTGGALALALAAQQPQAVSALVLWSPLVRERGSQLDPLLWPWGRSLMWLVHNQGRDVTHEPAVGPIWTGDVHLDGYVALAELTRGLMTDDLFGQVTAPVFMGYYDRDPDHQDPTVSVAAMLRMYDRLGTPAALRRRVDFPDAGAHVIASPLRSHAAAAVCRATRDYLRDVVGLPYAPGADVGVCDMIRPDVVP
ncbi:alpha/beta hydrolase [Gluconacetobacter azotocaptans]|uniref:Alpha/beta hydrolase n=1 Tax=Gluconacetobacter azotocaptans TaxID=142834 RepID=A0A7W4PGK7_9PROT|nr:alpha/beta hydrolase [Gluconacetobacter azotocaptans]MBB2190096.1 alpha/beta hydrolase [Gluconacetobacter azotocaptans]GBQ26150.1 putative hydrolase [Gluconacetobacter azotocaptans DSM 13594]